MESNQVKNTRSKEEIIKIHEEFDNDSKKLTDEFNRFSEKYGKHIGGFELQRVYDTCWKMRIIVDGRLFH